MIFAGAAWWSMASHLAAQDYLARIQATGLNFPSLNDPYSLGLTPHTTSHRKSGNSSGSKSSSLSTSQSNKKDKSEDGKGSSSAGKYSAGGGITIQPTMKLPINTNNTSEHHQQHKRTLKVNSTNELNYSKSMDKIKTLPTTTATASASVKVSSPSIFTSPLSLVSNFEKSVSSTLCSQNNSSDGVGNAAISPTSSILRWVYYTCMHIWIKGFIHILLGGMITTHQTSFIL